MSMAICEFLIFANIQKTYFNVSLSEHLVGPCFWIGTSLGNVVLFAASFPPAGEQRQTQPVLTFNTGIYHKNDVLESVSYK